MNKIYCCPKNSIPGFISNYLPKGETFRVKDLDVYKIGNSPKSIFWFYDIYGIDGGHTKKLVDLISSWGYTVYLPDLLRGSWPIDAPKDDKLIEWLKLYPPSSLEDDIYNKLFPFAEEHGANQFGTIGTCWGAWCIFALGNCDKFKFGINTHPSIHLGKAFNQKEADLARGVVFPQLITNSDDEPENVMPGGEVIKILEEKFGDVICKYYPGTSHGYFSRGDMSDEVVRNAVEETLTLSKGFIEKHFN